MQLCCKNINFARLFMKTLVKIFLFIFIGTQASAQISVLVKDENGKPLEQAHILILPDSVGGVTNTNGFHVFSDMPRKKINLWVAFMGYEPQTVSFENTGIARMIEVKLLPEAKIIQEIIVHDHHNHQEEVLSSIHIDFRDIGIYSMPTFAKTIEKIPGIHSMNVGVGISKPVIRGLFANRVIVNHYNIKQEGQQWGTDHGLEIDPFDVTEIEIIKGPASLQYGSDGLGGVINILPNKIPKMNTLTTEVSTVYRSNNHHAGLSALLAANKNGWFFTGRYTYQNWGDYIVPQDTFIYNTFELPIFNNILKNTAGVENHVAVSAGKSSSKGVFRISHFQYNQEAGIFSGAMGIPRSFTLADDGDRRNIDVPSQLTRHYKTVFNAKWYAAENWDIHINAAHQINQRKEFSFPEFHRRPVADRNDTEALKLVLNTYTLNAHADHDFSEKWKNVYGFDIQYQTNRRDGWDFLLPDFNTFRSGVYFIADYKASESLDINGGLRADLANNTNSRYTQLIYNSNADVTDSLTVGAYNNWFYNFSASLGMNKKLNENTELKANFGKSFRVPYPNETVSNGVHHGTFRHEQGNPDLKTEHGYQLDISSDYDTERFSIRGAVFGNYFHQFIYLRPSARFSPLPEAGQLFQYTQSNALFAGFELDWHYNFYKNLVWYQTAEYVWNVNMDNKLPLPFTPPASVSNELVYRKGELFKGIELFSIGVYYKYVFAQNRVDRNELKTPDFHYLGAEMWVTTLIKGNELDFSLQVQNMLNARYFNHLSRYRLLNIPEQGINFVVQLNYRFSAKLK
jgi:iron complex outermembrane recepter protein